MDITSAILTGTDKQIAWASDIRAKVAAEATAIEAKHGPAPEGSEFARSIAQLATITDAAWWIDCGRYGLAVACKHAMGVFK